MTIANSWEALLPDRIAALGRDHRGYPVPFIVMRDAAGKPAFAVNDSMRVQQAIRENLCHICGQKLEANPWFVGGPGSAFLNGDRAVYHDGPMHRECMHFALQVCPHLLQRMTRATGPMQSAHLRKEGVATIDTTLIPGTPDVFVAVQAYRFTVSGMLANLAFHVAKPFRKTEYWQAGAMMPKDEGEKAAKTTARKLAATHGL